VLLGPGANHDEFGVHYERFLGRLRLAQPRFEPLYPHHDLLFALLQRADSEGQGMLSLEELSAVCSLMYSHLGSEAELCKDLDTLLSHMGAAGDEAQRTGTLEISEICAKFEIVRERTSGRRPSIFGMLKRATTRRLSINALTDRDTPRG